MRRRVTTVASLALVVPSVAAVVALAAGGRGGERLAAAPSTAGVTSTSTPVTSMSSPATSTTSPVTAASAVTTTTSAATTTTSAPPVPTLAPIVTFDARVGAGVGAVEPVPVTAPVRVVIPALGADGPVTPAGVDERGELAIPAAAGELVWWRYGPTPGAPGSAVIAGHLDWKGRLGVFNRLAETPIGERVVVTYDDGHDQTFVVTSVELVDKPAVAVDGTFARDGQPVLRLVTCGGEFDRAARSYRSNVVVTAVPA